MAQTSQELLPEARVVYCSATGASEPRNLGYMVRLGLWGDGTSFQNFHQFLGLCVSTLNLFFGIWYPVLVHTQRITLFSSYKSFYTFQ
jgi:hypothetical protein